MPALFPTLEFFRGKSCKIVYLDGGWSAGSKAFYGELLDYDEKFQTWRGKNDPEAKEIYVVNFHHDAVTRIVLRIG